MNHVAHIFEDKPTQWGLRGDSHLWEELRLTFEDVEQPLTEDEFEDFLINSFKELISDGDTRNSTDSILIERYARDGMSGGHISLKWWTGTGLPLLKERFMKLDY